MPVDPEPSLHSEPVADWLVGGGEMGRLIRAMDWSQTPLGPLVSWPPSLRTTVNLLLNSNFPISLAWGPSHTQIYNDGYWPICAAKHPGSMGQDFTGRHGSQPFEIDRADTPDQEGSEGIADPFLFTWHNDSCVAGVQSVPCALRNQNPRHAVYYENSIM